MLHHNRRSSGPCCFQVSKILWPSFSAPAPAPKRAPAGVLPNGVFCTSSQRGAAPGAPRGFHTRGGAPKRSSARLLRLLHRDCHLCPRFRCARLLPRYPGHFARSASSRRCGCGKPGGGWRGRLPEAAWRRAGGAAGGVRGRRGQLRAADGAAGCRGRAADAEASCGLCGRRVGQLPWRWLAGSEEAGDEHRGWCGEFGRQGVQGIRR